MDCFLEELVTKQSECVKASEAEVLEYQKKLLACGKKRVPLHKFDGLEAEKELIRYSIEESRLRKDVYLRNCIKIQAKLEDRRSDEVRIEDINSLRASFDRETKRYDQGLPIYAHRLAIMEMIERHQVCIVIGETGSGKSTQLVQYLSEAGYAANGFIACTQPRKLAAISLAEHVSTEVGGKVGSTYGYVAAGSKRGTNTEVLYMTDHTLLNECIADPNLSKYSCLVIDEAHERSIHTDILIAFIKRCLPNRPDLKVVITSATINPTLFSTYFGGPYTCPVIEVPGRTYPVSGKWDEAVYKVHEIHLQKPR